MIDIEKGYRTRPPPPQRRFRVGPKFPAPSSYILASTSISGLVSFIGADGVVHRGMIDVLLHVVGVFVCECVRVCVHV